MSLNVKKLNPLAYIPILQQDKSYEIYAGNNYQIDSGKSCCISTGLAISIPTGYHAGIYSSSAAQAYNVETSSFCSINHHAYKETITQTVQELKVTLRNFGSTIYNVKRGDPIARLVIHQVKQLPVYEVEKLDDITQDFSVQMKLRGVKSFPGRVRPWFILEYKNTPDKFREKYVTNEILLELNEYKQTQEYIRSKTKLELEAKFLYNCIEKDNTTHGDPPQTMFEKAKHDYSLAKAKAQNI
jgi:dUTPase